MEEGGRRGITKRGIGRNEGGQKEREKQEGEGKKGGEGDKKDYREEKTAT